MARHLIPARVWKGTGEPDRPSLSVCRVGDTFLAPGIADEVILNGAGSLAWQSLVSNGALTVETSTGGTAGSRTLTVSTRVFAGSEASALVEVIAQPVTGETVTITPATGRIVGAVGGTEAALTSKRVVKTTAACVFTVTCTEPTEHTTVDVIVNGRHEASIALPFTPT